MHLMSNTLCEYFCSEGKCLVLIYYYYINYININQISDGVPPHLQKCRSSDLAEYVKFLQMNGDGEVTNLLFVESFLTNRSTCRIAIFFLVKYVTGSNFCTNILFLLNTKSKFRYCQAVGRYSSLKMCLSLPSCVLYTL